MNKILNQEGNFVRFSVLTLMVVLASLYRLMPHPWNIAPVGAMALFGGAYFGNKYAAVLVPLVTLWISDLILNNLIFSQYFNGFTLFYDGFGWQYGSFILISMIGFALKNKIKIVNVILASIGSSLLFFVISNFGVWISGQMYPLTFAGLNSCFIAALPFLKNTLIGDLIFSGILFGTFEFAKKKYHFLQLQVGKA